jgi:hypothetical protein
MVEITPRKGPARNRNLQAWSLYGLFPLLEKYVSFKYADLSQVVSSRYKMLLQSPMTYIMVMNIKFEPPPPALPRVAQSGKAERFCANGNR